jgi:allantoicase
MHLPQWFWRVRFRTPDGGGETLVVAPHRAAAKQAIATPAARVTAYESTTPGERVVDGLATQRFAGYYPSVRRALDAGRTAVRNRLGDGWNSRASCRRFRERGRDWLA